MSNSYETQDGVTFEINIGALRQAWVQFDPYDLPTGPLHLSDLDLRCMRNEIARLEQQSSV